MTSSVLIDIIVFAAFIIAVVALGLYKSRGENGSEGYFLAGRGRQRTSSALPRY